jgi:hypothetical protein
MPDIIKLLIGVIPSYLLLILCLNFINWVEFKRNKPDETNLLNVKRAFECQQCGYRFRGGILNVKYCDGCIEDGAPAGLGGKIIVTGRVGGL